MRIVGATCVAIIFAVGIVWWINLGSLPKEGEAPPMGSSGHGQDAVDTPSDANRVRDEMFLRELEARNAASTEEHKRRAAEMLKDPLYVVIPLSQTGELSDSVIEQLDISGAEAAALRKVILEFVSDASTNLTDRAKLISAKEGKYGVDYHYYARASKDRGKSMKEQISKKVATIIGDSRAEAFMKGLDDQSIYGGLGQYDVDITLYSDEQGKPSVSYKLLSPENGGVSRFGGGTLDDENFALWGKLDFPEVPTE